MAKYITKTYRCPVCGEEHEYSVLVSYRSSNTYLDLGPTQREYFEMYLECPKCHYVSMNPGKPANKDAFVTVCSKEYQDCFDSDLSTAVKKCIAMAMMSESEKNALSAARSWLRAFYAAEMDQLPSETYRKKAVDAYQNAMESGAGGLALEDFCALCDLLRQEKRFAEAEELANALIQNAEDNKNTNNEPYRVLLREKEYIHNRDYSRHLLKEEVA